jgi:hypothetical protein
MKMILVTRSNGIPYDQSIIEIAFANGLTEKIGDSKNVILSYGVNDCYSRSIVVSKKKIEMILLDKHAVS